MPTRVYWSSYSPLDPSDTNHAVDIYGWDIGNTTYNSSIHLMTGGQDLANVENGSATDDGTVTLFSSSASNLPGSNGLVGQVYVRRAGIDTNVSQPLGVAPRTSDAGFAYLDPQHQVSNDGSEVAFTSDAPAFGSVPGPQGPPDQVLVRNVVTGVTTLASAASNGVTAGNGSSSDPSIDAAGNLVVFESSASNLVPGDDNQADDVFVHNLSTGATTLVDRTAGGGPPAQGAYDPEISADGTKVVFISRSIDLPGAALDGNEHVYEVDLATGDETLIDRDNAGDVANGGAREVDLDGNGQRVAFISNASNLGGSTDDSVYVRDLTNPASPTTTWVSVPQDGNPAHDSTFYVSIDGDGGRVAWTETNPNFGFGMTEDNEVFVRDLASKTTQLVSTGPAGVADQDASEPSLSADGTRVSFESEADNLPGAIPGYGNVFVRDLATGTTVLGSARDGTDSSGRFGAGDGSLSGNGECVAFDSQSDDLVSGGYGSDFEHIFLHALSGACPAAAPPHRRRRDGRDQRPVGDQPTLCARR